MTEEQFFTTGEIIKLTTLKLSSVQRYIKTFHEFFSPGAGLPDRRRRLTSQDVKTLLLIKYLYSIRESKSEIIKSLRGEKIVPAVSWIEISHALDIASSAEKARKECEDIYKKMQVDLHRHKCFIQDRVLEFRRTAALVIAEEHDMRVALDLLIAKQNADSRMQFDNIRALESGNGLSDTQKRNLKAITKIMAYEQQETILSQRQQTAADNLVKERESQLETVTTKKGMRLVETIGNMIYRLSLSDEDRSDLAMSEMRARWREEEENK